jgi:hypothetical protein
MHHGLRRAIRLFLDDSLLHLFNITQGKYRHLNLIGLILDKLVVQIVAFLLLIAIRHNVEDIVNTPLPQRILQRDVG